MRLAPALIIFDCDGVLIDSEHVASRIIAEELSAQGWVMSSAESEDLFLGMSITDMVPMIEAHLGRALPAGWRDMIASRLVTALAHEAVLIPYADDILRAVTALGIPWRVASNSSQAEMNAKFSRVGLNALMAGRTHSGGEVARPKPAPDVYLAAAAAQGVGASQCLVIEDSPLGVRGAVAAGMTCLGFAPHGNTALRALGAVDVLTDLRDLLPLLIPDERLRA
ncbi:MAG: hypothetical protein B7Z78_06855 [Rhodospirillales bacterium 20-60-12]|nr:MAG: hypothetical protein B7Z78_06855 [Rhodospirillales bacterium 20-60-12]OYV58960.1 MAG: hypothetical protein B7X01_03355 [Acidiphilium sp. 21-62-4]HQT68759.1 HAD family phosphatase [Acetobacteraceae bacterium]